MKRNMFTVVLLAMVLLFFSRGEVCAKEVAKQAYTFKQFKYTYDEDGTICINRYFGGEKVVRVPDEIDGVPVRHLGQIFSGNKKITKVYLPEGIEEIDGFYNCISLREVNIPKSAKKICGDAFSNCRKLKKVDLPEGLRSIESYAFAECKSLTQVAIPDTVTELEAYAFEDCMNLESVVLPSGLKKIKEYTFRGCEELKSISLPSNLKSIGDSAFCHCIKLESITIPKKVTKISASAFAYCTDLKKITVKGTKISTIGTWAFTKISEDAVFDVPDKIKSKFQKKLKKAKRKTEKMWKIV